ncbi:hypothetical protein KEM56_006382 [Ascosphaera pollenicola]|nr:hypothetical protein KEM56_006382 [Ascosphaera pollenicola]
MSARPPVNDDPSISPWQPESGSDAYPLQDLSVFDSHEDASLHPAASSSAAAQADTDAQYRDKRSSTCLTSDSGTDADDEGPSLSRSISMPAFPDDRVNIGDAAGLPSSHISRTRSEGIPRPGRRSRGLRKDEGDIELLDPAQERTRKDHLQVLRRVSESALMISIGAIVSLGIGITDALHSWHLEFKTFLISIALLYSTYPIRKYTLSFIRRRYTKLIAFPFSPQFDPAPLIYPVFLPLLISSSLSKLSSDLILPNMVMGLCSLPPQIVPLFTEVTGYSPLHWMLTVLPFLPAERSAFTNSSQLPLALRGQDPERLVLLYPLHQTLSANLYFLTTSSLLPSELQLLTTGLINLLLYTEAPQAEVLKAILWVGGLCVLLACKDLCHMEVMLSRIPTWKFKRPSSRGGFLWRLDQKLCSWLCQGTSRVNDSSDSDSAGRSLISRERHSHRRNDPSRRSTSQTDKAESASSAVECDNARVSMDSQSAEFADLHGMFNSILSPLSSLRQRRRSSVDPISAPERSRSQSPVRTTHGGRRRKLVPAILQPYLLMTAAQAQTRKMAYAVCVYIFTLAIIFGPVRLYIRDNTLGGAEPVGWLIGYMFGNISFFRFWIVMSRLDTWVPLPPREDHCLACDSPAWVEHLRQDVFGAANSRLLICAYYMSVLIVGLLIVLRLSSIVETDTRRKVFHGMMVAMLLPTTFVDPAFVSIALSLVLSVFLLLEVFRAAQLPPIAKPLTLFIAPYVDGRDYCGPVVISHIFLLIGCAIPLWLSLASITFDGSSPWEGWDAHTRDVSMVSGIICVGMGDAAASLIGRRFGRRRWFFGGGKSIEGSIAFAVAVFVGLIAARTWLVLGGWDSDSSLVASSTSSFETQVWAVVVIAAKAALAAMGASFTEAVLTGGNDNVVVPLVLWLLVRGLRV